MVKEDLSGRWKKPLLAVVCSCMHFPFPLWSWDEPVKRPSSEANTSIFTLQKLWETFTPYTLPSRKCLFITTKLRPTLMGMWTECLIVYSMQQTMVWMPKAMSYRRFSFFTTFSSEIPRLGIQTLFCKKAQTTSFRELATLEKCTWNRTDITNKWTEIFTKLLSEQVSLHTDMWGKVIPSCVCVRGWGLSYGSQNSLSVILATTC